MIYSKDCLGFDSVEISDFLNNKKKKKLKVKGDYYAYLPQRCLHFINIDKDKKRSKKAKYLCSKIIGVNKAGRNYLQITFVDLRENYDGKPFIPYSFKGYQIHIKTYSFKEIKELGIDSNYQKFKSIL